MNVDERCFAFRDSINSRLSYLEKSDNKDDMIIGKIHLKSENRNEYDPVAESKRRIFWQAVRELANPEIMLADEKVTDSSIINSAQSRVLNVFPDEAKRLDGRPWLPPHWAVSLPNTDKLDHRSAGSSEDLHKQFWLQSHLWRTPEWKCSNLLPSLGRIFRSLHHWKHNSSLALVQELIRIYPPALEMKDNSCNTPLYCAWLPPASKRWGDDASLFRGGQGARGIACHSALSKEKKRGVGARDKPEHDGVLGVGRAQRI
eukprot:gene40523-54794_t